MCIKNYKGAKCWGSFQKKYIQMRWSKNTLNSKKEGGGKYLKALKSAEKQTETGGDLPLKENTMSKTHSYTAFSSEEPLVSHSKPRWVSVVHRG